MRRGAARTAEAERLVRAVRAEDAPGVHDPRASADEPAASAAVAASDRLVLGPVTVTGAAAGMARVLLPRPGEPLLDYRDRVLPLAQAAAAPHRARVKRWRDELVGAARLDAAQAQALEQAASEAGDALKEQILAGVLGGELMPPTLRPMRGVRFTHELLGTLVDAERRFRARLSPAQQEALDAGRFDFADYVLFSTRWEDVLGVTD